MNLLTGNCLSLAINIVAVVLCLVSTVLNIIEQHYVVAALMAILVAANVYFGYLSVKRINSTKEDML